MRFGKQKQGYRMNARSRSTVNSTRRPVFESLEPRGMLSATIGSMADPVVGDCNLPDAFVTEVVPIEVSPDYGGNAPAFHWGPPGRWIWGESHKQFLSTDSSSWVEYAYKISIDMYGGLGFVELWVLNWSDEPAFNEFVANYLDGTVGDDRVPDDGSEVFSESQYDGSDGGPMDASDDRMVDDRMVDVDPYFSIDYPMYGQAEIAYGVDAPPLSNAGSDGRPPSELAAGWAMYFSGSDLRSQSLGEKRARRSDMRWSLVSLAVLAIGVSSTCFSQNPPRPSAQQLPDEADLQVDLLPAKLDNSTPATDRSTLITPAGTYVRPEDGSKDPDLEKAWADYDADIKRAKGVIIDALENQRIAARKVGDFEAAKKYKELKEAFETNARMPALQQPRQADFALGDIKTQVEQCQAAFKLAAGKLKDVYLAVEAKLVADIAISEQDVELVIAERRLLFPDKPQPQLDPAPVPPPQPDPIVRDIPPRAIKAGKHSYFFFTDKLTQTQAQEACKMRGGYLARITESNEFDALFTRLKLEHRELQFWIDGTDAASEGTWTFLDGQKLRCLFRWVPGQPDKGGHHGNNADALKLWVTLRNGEWVVGLDDDRYDNPSGFLCEWDEEQVARH